MSRGRRWNRNFIYGVFVIDIGDRFYGIEVRISKNIKWRLL
jgi:hypothetical protein